VETRQPGPDVPEVKGQPGLILFGPIIPSQCVTKAPSSPNGAATSVKSANQPRTHSPIPRWGRQNGSHDYNSASGRTQTTSHLSRDPSCRRQPAIPGTPEPGGLDWVEVTTLVRLVAAEKHVVAGDVLLGIISDRDIRRVCGLKRIQDEAAQATAKFYLGRSTASEIMTTDLRTATREATLLDVAHEMTAHAIGCVPVVDGRKLAGLLTDTDIVRIVARLDR